MNPRIAKEIRLLLPVWVVALLLVLSPMLVENAGFSMIPLFLFGCVILGIAPFGREILNNTLPQMLAQSVPRSVLWREKNLVSFSALLIFMAVFHLAFWSARPDSLGGYFVDGYFIVGIIVPFFAMCAGAFLIIFIKQVSASFWLLILLGGIIALAILSVGDWLNLKDKAAEIYSTVAYAAAYALASVVAFVLARKKFFNFEDTGVFSREIIIPLKRIFGLSDRATIQAPSVSSSFGSLCKKELQLQQVNFVFILGCYAVLAAHLLILAPGVFARESLDSKNELIIDAIVAITRLVGIIAPFVVGAVAIAEERRYGLDEWHLTLPPSRLKQWSIKLLTCLALAFVLGSGFILMIDFLALSFPELNPFKWFVGTSPLNAGVFPALGYYFILPIIGVALGLLASSLTKNYLQSLSILAGLIAIGPFLTILANALMREKYGVGGYSNEAPPQNLFLVTFLPLLILISLGLSYRNFSFTEMFRKKLRNTVVILLAMTAFSLATTAFGYFRVWDYFLYESPANPRYAQAGEVTPSMSMQYNHGVAIGSDGTLWRWGVDISKYDQFMQLIQRNGEEWRSFMEATLIRTPIQIGRDSDWVQVLAKRGGILALKNDGTLWALGGWMRNGNLRSALGIDHITEELTQVGEADNWQKIAGEYYHTLGLKNDGTLWIWGLNSDNELGLENREAEYVFPTQVGNETDWKDIAVFEDANFALKTDGSLWTWGSGSLGARTPDRIGALPKLFYNATPIEAIYASTSLFAKQKDGTVIFWGGDWPGISKNEQSGPLYELKDDIDWRQIGPRFVITTEGSLRMKYYRGQLFSSIWRFFGTNWVAHDRYYGARHYGITRDGTLWQWGSTIEEWYSSSSDEDERFRLIPDRYHPKPLGTLRADARP